MNPYNTQQGPLILKEYGRNIQNLVDHIQTIEDREKRSESAFLVIELMKQINPSLKDSPEYAQKLWDDLFIISDFKLDVDSPYPKPERTIFDRKPNRLEYSQSDIQLKHFGKNILQMIEKTAEMEDPEKKEAALIHIGRLMKSYASIWNKENVDDETLVKNIEKMSKGKLTIDLQKVRDENLFEPLIKERRPAPQRGKRNNGGYKGKRRRN